MKKILGISALLLAVITLFTACGQTSGENTTMSCSLNVKCDTILKNTDKLNEEKKDIVPENGIILSAENVSFDEGQNMLEILIQELKNRKIHIDFEEKSSTGVAYVKGIANIYSGDCGELSGWMIRVNGEDLTVGCSDYFPQNGDKIEWLYTCDMGNDL